MSGPEELNSLRNFARSCGRSGGCREEDEAGAVPVGCGDLGAGLAVDLGRALDDTPSICATGPAVEKKMSTGVGGEL